VRVRAALVVVCLLIAGSAWAQEQPPVPEKICGMSVEQFNRKSAELQRAVCLMNKAGAEAEAKELRRQNPEPIRSRKMVIAGVVIALGGVAMVMPGGDTYHVLGDAFCVSDYSVDYGSCRAIAPAIGAGMLAGGIALAYFGSRPVTVSPMISHGMKGASVRIKWGGSRARN
jgi:hypothetical protein